MDRRNVWKTYTQAELKEMEDISARYKRCLDEGKTERECVEVAERLAKEAGYRCLCSYKEAGEPLKEGDKVYASFMGKMILLFQIGKEPLENGMNILGAHIDSPRIDIKQNPLYETDEMAYLDTHYYGGIKKYQWLASPLSLHGVIVKKDGTKVRVNIGENENDPVFVITDLLVHLAGKQMSQKASEVIEGDNLDLLIGSRPLTEAEGLKEDEKEAVQAGVLRLMEETYGIGEEDFVSAELEIVPAGSVGATGMHSRFFENTIAELIALTGEESELKVRRALQNSKMLSSDVSAAYDPMFAAAFEKRSSAFFGKGLVFNKFTGSHGKNGSNDANAEYLAEIRNVMDEAEVGYQFAELGKVDVGGGGTIAYIMAQYGMEVIDSGVAVLCMHAMYEISSKADVYEAVKGYKAFIEKIGQK